MDNNLSFWTGVVENRIDPEQLGRCQVRIFGYHPENVNDLPTQDLPWAIPLQSITSAAISGIGSAPVGIVPGTWVMGFFLDGSFAQKPVIMGTIAGKPSNSQLAANKQQQDNIQTNTNVLKDSQENVVTSDGKTPLEIEKSSDPLENFGVITKDDVLQVKEAIGLAISGGDYSKQDGGKFGKYQFTYQQLIVLGYVFPPVGAGQNVDEFYDPAILDDPSRWSNKNGISSKEEFLSNEDEQEAAMEENMLYNYNNMVRLKKIDAKTNPGVVAGLVASAHIGGYARADLLGAKTGDTVLRTYFELGAASINYDTPSELADRTNALQSPTSSYVSNSDSNQFSIRKGFEDPSKQYPTSEYNGLSDLNKLAVGDTSHRIFSIKENNKNTDIPIARSTNTWEEPDSAYSAVYPYNQVVETEAGHVIELDNTKGQERIHVFHKSGAYIEIDVNGTMVKKTMGDNYEFVENNNYLHVKGAETITIEGRTRILVQDRADLVVEGGLSITSNRDMLIQSARTMGLIAENFELTTQTGIDIASKGPVNIQGSSVNISATEGSVVTSAAKTIFDLAGEDYNLRSGRDIKMQATNSFSAKTEKSDINLDAGQIMNIRMGRAKLASGTAPAQVQIRDTPESLNPEAAEPDNIGRTTESSTNGDDTYGTPEAQNYRKEQEAKGKFNNNIYYPPFSGADRYIGPSPTDPNVAPDCGDLERRKDEIEPTEQLSDNYTLGDFITGPWKLQQQGSAPVWKIVCNLRVLARAVVEPIRAQYSGVRISSGFRNPNASFPNLESDHLRGCAVDLIFPRRSLAEYQEIAVWIQKNIPYKQLLLEYSADAKGRVKSAWIHVALELSPVAGRPIPTSKSSSVGTIVNHDMVYPDQLINLA